MSIKFYNNGQIYDIPTFDINEDIFLGDKFVPRVYLRTIENGQQKQAYCIAAADSAYDYGSRILDSSYPTIVVSSEEWAWGETYQKKYYAVKSIRNKYHIPAGTYTPSVFENMIKQYIIAGGSRVVDNNFSVTLQSSGAPQTVNMTAGQLVHFRSNGVSPWNNRYVSFGNSNIIIEDSCNPLSGFKLYKHYVTWLNPSYTSYRWALLFSGYSNFSITVNTGIRFR